MFSSHAGITSDGMSKERFAVGVLGCEGCAGSRAVE